MRLLCGNREWGLRPGTRATCLMWNVWKLGHKKNHPNRGCSGEQQAATMRRKQAFGPQEGIEVQMELSDSLNVIHRNYAKSLALLKGYLLVIDFSRKRLKKEQGELFAKLQALHSGEPDPFPPEPGVRTFQLSDEQVDLVLKLGRMAEEEQSAHPNLTLRMSFVYLVALFDAFLTDIFANVVKTRPTILKSSKKQITYDRLLEFGTFEAIVEFIASRELNELSYKSIKDQADYYRDRFGVALEDSGVSVNELVELRCTRNLLVHTNGVVNHIYLEQVSGTTYKSGDDVQVDAEYFSHAVKSLEAVASFITAKLIEKHATVTEGETSIR